MLTIVIRVDAPLGQAIGIKEALAMELERYGDARVVSATETAPEQLELTTGQSRRQEAKKWSGK